MATPKVSNTITQFREDVKSRGGPQIAGMYEVTLFQNTKTPITCYPLSVVLPGRMFLTYDHDIWGTVRKVPYKRAYTQCNMTFVVYQDWAERTYIESWMNTIIRHDSRTLEKQLATDAGESVPANSGALTAANPTAPQLSEKQVQAISGNIGGNLGKDASFGKNTYNEYVDYYNGIGSITINMLNSQTKKPNRTIQLLEAFPTTISPLSLAADGSGYPTFSVAFQFNDYNYK
jgi:hypothetical protein